VPRPKRKKDNMIERTYLKPFEIQIMIDNVKKDQLNEHQRNRDLLILMIFLYTGIRCTALTEINMSDIDKTNLTLTIIDKRNKKRVFEIDHDLIELYNRVCEYNKKKKWGTEALFVSNRGQRISSSTVAKLIEKYTQNITKKITPHKLRRTYGTNMYHETGDIYAVKAALGHEDIRTTQIYVNVDNTEAAAKGMVAMKKNIRF
jgi:site-specific recombinase XerD